MSFKTPIFHPTFQGSRARLEHHITTREGGLGLGLGLGTLLTNNALHSHGMRLISMLVERVYDNSFAEMLKAHNTIHLKQSFNFQRKIGCLGWDLNPQHSILDDALTN